MPLWDPDSVILLLLRRVAFPTQGLEFSCVLPHVFSKISSKNSTEWSSWIPCCNRPTPTLLWLVLFRGPIRCLRKCLRWGLSSWGGVPHDLIGDLLEPAFRGHSDLSPTGKHSEIWQPSGTVLWKIITCKSLWHLCENWHSGKMLPKGQSCQDNMRQ